MGKKLDALLGKSFKTSKFKKFVDLTISRIAFLRVQHHACWSQARSEVVQLLTLGHQESTLLRVDHVIREQKMLDVLMIIEGYCRLLIERIILVKNSKECPDELKEAISSLIFAASKYGQLPELQKIRGVLASKFGKQFAKCAVELRNNCGVNPKIVKKLLLRRSSLGTRLKVLKEIASENGITLRIQEKASQVIEDKENIRELTKFNDPDPKDDVRDLLEDTECNEKLSSFMKTRKKYKDAASAAQEAFELAAHAAVAARAAVELSRLSLNERHPDYQYKSSHGKNIFEDEYNNTIFDAGGISRSKFQIDQHSASRKIHVIDISPKSRGGEMEGNKCRSLIIESGHNSYMKEAVKKVSSASSSDFSGNTESEETVSSSYVAGQNHSLRQEIRNHSEKGKKQDAVWWLEHCDSAGKYNFLTNQGRNEDDSDDNGDVLNYQSPWQRALPAPVTHSVEGRTTSGSTHDEQLHSESSKGGRKPISVRTRRTLSPLKHTQKSSSSVSIN